MRCTRRVLIDFVFDTPSRRQRNTARQVEHWRTKKLQESRTTTNPYHKAQYVNAFLEAQSAAAVHRHAVDAQPASQALLASNLEGSRSASQELTELAHELETRHQGTSNGNSSSPALTSGKSSLEVRNATARQQTGLIEFGAWRSTSDSDARLHQRIRSVDVTRHCVIREARTPPELSPEVIQRGLPRRPSPLAVYGLLRYLDSRSFRATTKPIEMEKLQSRVREALQALRYSHEMQKSVALFAVYALSCHRDWSTSSAFVLWLHAQWPLLTDCTNSPEAAHASSKAESTSVCVTDTSHFVALLFDTLRWASPSHPAALPTLEELTAFCADFARISKERAASDKAAVDTDGDTLPWTPVVAAPLLSIAGLREGCDTNSPTLSLSANDLEAVHRLTDVYCVQRVVPSSYRHRKKQATALAYMPPLAWGEHLRALHRCGASLAALQAATDALTDAARTRHATQLLSNTHVWNAYLACSPGWHAVEVFEKNLKPYGVRDTPATLAAVVTALLNDKTVASRLQARALWDQLGKRYTAKKMTTGTCSTVLAHVRLLEAEGDRVGLAKLLISYEQLYECFGIPLEWYEKQHESTTKRHASTNMNEVTAEEGLRLLQHACAAFPFLIPPAVQVALTEALRRTAEAESNTSIPPVAASNAAERGAESNVAPAADTATPELTAEDLAAMM